MPPSPVALFAVFTPYLWISEKAFDLVDHAILLEKPADVKISLSLLKWIQSYLAGRTQQVKLSRTGCVIAGVPQGGVISSTLFNVFVNDIDDCCPPGLSISTCKYADDCSQYELVRAGYGSYMQDVMNNLEAWQIGITWKSTPRKPKRYGSAF